ncbi:MAG: hypothetical protein R3E79_29650 [Caldilineaceae bacterium]
MQGIKRYQGRDLTAVERRLVHGTQQAAEALVFATQVGWGVFNTAHIERLNATFSHLAALSPPAKPVPRPFVVGGSKPPFSGQQSFITFVIRMRLYLLPRPWPLISRILFGRLTNFGITDLNVSSSNAVRGAAPQIRDWRFASIAGLRCT